MQWRVWYVPFRAVEAPVAPSRGGGPPAPHPVTGPTTADCSWNPPTPKITRGISTVKRHCKQPGNIATHKVQANADSHTV